MDPNAEDRAEPTIATLSYRDAFERISIEIVALEALANAACTAIDACSPPVDSPSTFDRAQALIGAVFERAAAALALAADLKTAVRGGSGARR